MACVHVPLDYHLAKCHFFYVLGAAGGEEIVPSASLLFQEVPV